VDIATHALASFALARGFFPRRRWSTVVAMVFAGTVADFDLLSAWFGPAAYFAGRRTFTHSILGTLLVIATAAFLMRYLGKKQHESIAAALIPIGVAAILHVALDALQSEGVALLWPFSRRRFAADYLPSVDFWIFAFLLAGILVPEFFRLITSEIGVREKRPRGRNGAIIAFALLAAYVGARALFHAGSVASLDPHSYKGESARRVAAFPDAVSMFRWHGLVETQSLLCQVAVPAGFGKGFDPESADCVHKPEASPELGAAQNSNVARNYVATMPFPRAIVSKTPDGYEIVLRSMRDVAEKETRRLAARIDIDSHFQVSNEEWIWVREISIR
jgi:membrane-bound metal-dependent hydrolase YbcI (DUF457 family)